MSERTVRREATETVNHNVKVCKYTICKNDAEMIDLEINGVKIYGCFVNKSKNGNYFISFPQRKANNGEYYYYAYCRLSDADVNEILRQCDEERAKK